MKKIILCMVAVLLFTGCFGDKSEPQETATQSVAGEATGVGTVSGTTAQPEQKAATAFNAEQIVSNLATTPYTWSTKYDNCLALVIKNNSASNCELNINVTFKDANGNLIGAKDDSIEAFNAGGEVCVVFDNEEPFATYEYTYTAKELSYYDVVMGDLSIQTSPAKNKVIVSLTNNGSKVASFVTATALFMNAGQVVGYNYTYIGDDDSEIKAGATVTEEISYYGSYESPYDDVKVYLSGGYADNF